MRTFVIHSITPIVWVVVHTHWAHKTVEENIYLSFHPSKAAAETERDRLTGLEPKGHQNDTN